MKSSLFSGILLSAFCLATEAAASSHLRIDEGAPSNREVSDDVPAPFIYDPQSGKSLSNRLSLGFSGSAKESESIQIPFGIESGSFTIEMFVKPDSDPGHSFYVARKGGGDGVAKFALGANQLRQWKQTYYATFLELPDQKQDAWSTGHYVTISRLQNPNPKKDSPGNLDWRHFALVYDADAMTLTTYLDRWQKTERKLEGPLTFDDSPLLIGGGETGSGFSGKIDEVRISKGVLGPAEFLREVETPIEGVDFHSPVGKLPAEMVIDVRACFGAVGDGVHDDTAAFQKAFTTLANKVPGGWYTLYVPEGTYLISDTIRHKRFFVVQGAGPDKTIIKLKDGSPGFADKAKPKAVYGCGYTKWGEWGRGAGNHIGVYLFDFSIDTGSGNPAAVGLDHHSNNIGCVENVTIRSGDGEGLIGLSFVRPWPGPALIKNVRIEGFDHGIKLASQEYSMTFENIFLKDQKVAGIENSGNIIGIRKLVSENSVPAIISDGGNTMVALFDSELHGGGPEVAAIRSGGGIYVRDLETSGYSHAIRKRALVGDKRWGPELLVEGPLVKEFTGDKITTAGAKATGAIKLPIEETPEVPWGDLNGDWASIDEFEEHCEGDDWAPALEAAFASGKKTIYFPHTVRVRRSVKLRGPVERLIGTCRVDIAWAEDIAKQIQDRMRTESGPDLDALAKEPPAVIFDHPEADKVMVIERMSVAGLHHHSPATLVFRHGGPEWYRNGPGCGKLFMEDLSGNCFRFDHPQQVWVRQWNPEAHGAGPCIVSKGASIWALGFKTEYESSKLWASDGAKTEIYGAFIYPIGEIPADRPIFRNVDSQMSVQYGTSVYRSNHKVHVIEEREGRRTEIGNDALRWSGSRARMDLYVSP